MAKNRTLYNAIQTSLEGLPQEKKDKIKILDLEIARGFSLTKDTLADLRVFFPKPPQGHDPNIKIVVGQDWQENFHKWSNPEKILEDVDLVVPLRDDPSGVTGKESQSTDEKLKQLIDRKFNKGFLELGSQKKVDASSTQQREESWLQQPVQTPHQLPQLS